MRVEHELQRQKQCLLSLILPTTGTLQSSPCPSAELQLNINSGLSPPVSLSPPHRFAGCVYFAYSHTPGCRRRLVPSPPCLALKKSSCFLVFRIFAWVPPAPACLCDVPTPALPLRWCILCVFISSVLSPYFCFNLSLLSFCASCVIFAKVRSTPCPPTTPTTPHIWFDVTGFAILALLTLPFTQTFSSPAKPSENSRE